MKTGKMTTSTMQAISRKEYKEILQARKDELTDHPTEGENISVMQWTDKDGKVVLQAVYTKVATKCRCLVTYYKR